MLYSCAPAGRGSAAVVKSRRGKSLRIDIHCHYLNPEAAQKVAPLDPGKHEAQIRFANALTREVNVRQGMDRAAKLSDIETRLRDMDRMGIDIQAVSPSPPQTYYWTEPGLGAELARMVNERIAGIVGKWPDRFVGLGTVPMQDAGLAVAELDHCVERLGMRGVEINGSVNGMELTDKRLGLEKFFARAAELGIVVFMHPGGYTQGERLTEHYFSNVIGNPLETTVAASHLIFDGMLERHPGLRFVLAHGGGYLAHYWARMDHAWRARVDCRTRISRRPSSYLEKFHFDSIVFDRAMLKSMIERYGASQVLLGTDYPYDMGVDDPVGFLEGVRGLSRADRDLIMGGNAARLLGISARATTAPAKPKRSRGPRAAR